jgi:hypothetical protein
VRERGKERARGDREIEREREIYIYFLKKKAHNKEDMNFYIY